MIIRKPYAFLIKNFRKIHVFLLILSIYVLYKLVDVNRFVGEFSRLGTYDLYNDPVTKHISWLLMLSVFVLIVGSVSLLFLLRHKQKPWKIYLVPVIGYISLFFILNMIKGFFTSYSGDFETTDLRMSKDLLSMFFLVQVPIMGIYLMRIFGWDIKKFNFNADQEFLELSEEDREEIEIGLDIDKNTFIRGYKRLIRNINYFYLEHKGICKTIFAVLSVIILFNLYKFVFVTNKSYKVGDVYSANGYTFKVNNVYYTDKDYNGNIIQKKSNFVIVDLTIKNNAQPRKIYLENFHIKNGVKDYVTTRKTFETEFKDLGNTLTSTRELKRDEELDCIIVYKVDKNLNKNRFILYYQEQNYLRKIKLKVKDIGKVDDTIKLSLDDELNVGFRKNSDEVVFTNYLIVENAKYTTRKKSVTGTSLTEHDLVIDGDNRILVLEFSSNVWEAKNMIDFLENYGKLNYKDSEGNEETISIEDPIKKTYYGKSVYLKVPVELENAEELSLELTIRNKHYIYKIF